jgi:PhnB protein
MAIAVYINFNGNCREAVEFYAQVFGTDNPHMMAFGDAPANPQFTLPEEAKSLIMHAQLNIQGSTVMFSDVCPGMPFVAGNNISLAVVSKNIDDIQSFFSKLKEGGKVNMDLQETFWSKCYGQVTDKFGIQWQLSYDNGEMGM